MDNRNNTYAEQLSSLIQVETISCDHQPDKTKFYEFQKLLRQTFPSLFKKCQVEDFHGSMLLRWPGTGDDMPIMLMNHHDVVEAPGQWKYPPFSGKLADGKIWGRGTMDTKSGLWAMLRAADELAESGYTPKRDIYFVSTCNEETNGLGADEISRSLAARNIKFYFVLDEGGMILHEPISGAKATYALIGLGEKGCVDLKFIARSAGGHSSTPSKNTPLVRLGQFMAAVEKSNIFQADISAVTCQMYKRISRSMKQPVRFVLGHPKLFRPALCKILPSISPSAGAMLNTTVAFTMANGSDGYNVLPQEAWVIGNMRFSHHQGEEDSINAIKQLAEKFQIETQILKPGFPSPLSDYNTEAFRLMEKGVAQIFPGVIPTPYVMNGASDCRYMSRVSDNCFRFAPFLISEKQMDSVHGLDENIDISSLAPAVDFYKYIITEA